MIATKLKHCPPSHDTLASPMIMHLIKQTLLAVSHRNRPQLQQSHLNVFRERTHIDKLGIVMALRIQEIACARKLCNRVPLALVNTVAIYDTISKMDQTLPKDFFKPQDVLDN
jgi:hypothetical protein